MPRYPDNALEVALKDDNTRIGRPSQDPSPPPQKPGIIRRIINAITGNTFVETDTPLKRSTEIPPITEKLPDAVTSRPYVTEPARLTIEELEKKFAWMDEEEFDAELLKISREGRARRLTAIPGETGPDIRKPALPPISATEDDEDDVTYEDDEEDDTREVVQRPMSGGGRVILGNSALAAIIIAMTLFQS